MFQDVKVNIVLLLAYNGVSCEMSSSIIIHLQWCQPWDMLNGPKLYFVQVCFKMYSTCKVTIVVLLAYNGVSCGICC